MAYYIIAPGALNSSQSSSQLVRTPTNNLYAILIVSLRVQVYLSINNGKTWSLQNYANSPSSAGSMVAAAIDGNNVIHITYLTGGAVASYIQFSTTTNVFQNYQVVGSISGGTSPTIESLAIALDSNNIPHVAIAYHSSTLNEIFYSNLTSQYFFPPIVATNPNSASPSNVDIQINNSNVPVISFVDSGVSAVGVAVGNQNNANAFTANTGVGAAGTVTVWAVLQ